MQDTPKGLRRHIAILGRRNAGKSSLINCLAGQEIAIVSEHAGTTTDPVEKTMELAPLGPVVLIDTAGIDDVGDLGEKRVARTLAILRRADLAVIVAEGDVWSDYERELARRLDEEHIPYLIARNKADLGPLPGNDWRNKSGIRKGVPVVDTAALSGAGKDEVIASLAAIAEAVEERSILADLVPEKGVAVLVVPLDSGAPKGRLILPQAQAIRDCLDWQRICMICTEKDYPEVYKKLAAPPDLVVCDSQVVHLVAAQTPEAVPLTTFSILMARFKGDLTSFARGAAALEKLKPGDTVLIEEACSHHAQEDDIGRVKIPRLLRKLAGGDLDIRHRQGKEIQAYDPEIKAIIHCGACILTRRQMCQRQGNSGGIPMTNYGMAISLAQGILRRALKSFPDALAAFEKGRQDHL